MSTVRQQLNTFFISIQAKAFRQAEFATGNRDDALDLVQDSMMSLATRYADQPENWPRLFQRILQNAILDWHRRKKVRSILWWFQGEDKSGKARQEDEKECMDIEDKRQLSPEETNSKQQQLAHLYAAIKTLPLRQQQAFILRAWWEYDTRESALAMRCSEGSVKTHYSRAVKKLAELLKDETLVNAL